jgi:hypothetical protein
VRSPLTTPASRRHLSAVPGRASSIKPSDDRDGDHADCAQHDHNGKPLYDRTPLRNPRTIRGFCGKDARDPAVSLKRIEGRIGQDSCLPASLGNGKGPPKACIHRSPSRPSGSVAKMRKRRFWPVGKIQFFQTVPEARVWLKLIFATEPERLMKEKKRQMNCCQLLKRLLEPMTCFILQQKDWLTPQRREAH